MPVKDLHEEPFEPSTVTKLEIFQQYAVAWLPTFIVQRHVTEVHIFDFFAGPGYDRKSSPGSPIRLLQTIAGYDELLSRFKTKVAIHFNEFEPKRKNGQPKFALLQQNVSAYLAEHPQVARHATVHFYNKDAGQLFFDLLENVKKFPSLVYLDQNGVRFISQQFITALEQIKTVDFLIFVSSSYFRRFFKRPEFIRVLQLTEEEVNSHRYVDMHRMVCNALRRTLPANSQLKLYPFSIRKDINIFGIIFGAKHILAVHKFLDIAWKANSTNGEADFDIDNDNAPEPQYVQASLFDAPVPKKLTKVASFQQEIKRLVLSGEIADNVAALTHAYEAGHLPRHAAEVIKQLKEDKKIDYEGRTPGVSYENVYEKKHTISFKANGTIKH